MIPFLFPPSSHLQHSISESFHLSLISLVRLPAAVKFCILRVAEVVLPAADLAAQLAPPMVLSPRTHSHVQSHKHAHANTHPHYHIYEKLKIFMMNYSCTLNQIHELFMYITSPTIRIHTHTHTQEKTESNDTHTNRHTAHVHTDGDLFTYTQRAPVSCWVSRERDQLIEDNREINLTLRIV